MKKLTTEYVKAAIELVDGYKLLSEKYIGNKSKLEILHSCGNVFNMTWDNFSHGKRCPKHRYEKIGLALTKPFETVKAKIEAVKGYKLLSTEYIGAHSKLKIKHSCGDVFQMSWDSFNHGRRCPKCWIKNNRGENHSRWNHNLTDEERLHRDYNHKHESKKWRESVFNRDDYTCQLCNVRGCKLEAHHINSYKEFKDDRFNVDNGVTLCETCHDSYHYEFKPYMVDHHSFYHWMVLNSVIKPENWLWTVQYPKSMNGWLKAYKRAS